MINTFSSFSAACVGSHKLVLVFYLTIASFLVLTLAVFFTLSKPCAAGYYQVRKNAEGLTFDIPINRNPPVMGDNEIRIEIKIPQGDAVLGAEVLVNYYMPPMPRMAPMNYTFPAPPKDGDYRASWI